MPILETLEGRGLYIQAPNLNWTVIEGDNERDEGVEGYLETKAMRGTRT